ncbi:MAG: hypothetical protein JWP99_16 [Devosia sp.]|nr:hypothetical protein [Devosia sp.]
MARASEQFRQSDATSWGVVALVLCGIAVMGANVSALVPSSALGGLHRTRIEGASLEQLRVQIADLREESVLLRRENGQLLTRFALKEQQGNEVVQRVSALEVSLPRLLEALPDSAPVDRTLTTSSIGDDQPLVYEAEGGSVAVRQRPMPDMPPALSGEIPPLVESSAAIAPPPSAGAFAVALGLPVAGAEADGAWRDLSMKLGPLLFGLDPRLVAETGGELNQLVAGPLPRRADATALCGRIERVAISCAPIPFTGTPLGSPALLQ